MDDIMSDVLSRRPTRVIASVQQIREQSGKQVGQLSGGHLDDLETLTKLVHTRVESKQLSYPDWLREVEKLIEKISEYIPTDLPRIRHPTYNACVAVWMTMSPGVNIPPVPVLVDVLGTFPFLVNLLLVGKTHEEFFVVVQELLHEIGDNPSSAGEKLLKELLTPTPERLSGSALHLLHYLGGLTFSDDKVYLPKSDISFSDGLGRICINMSYKVRDQSTVIVYKPVMRLKTKILSTSAMENYKSFLQLPTTEPKEPLGIVGDISKGAHVLLDYNTTPGYVSVANETLSAKEAKDFVEFRYRCSIPREVFVEYLATEITKPNVNEYTPPDLSEFKKEVVKLLGAAKRAYDASGATGTEATLVQKKMFVKHLMSSVIRDKLLPNAEIPWFNLYLAKILKGDVFIFQTINNTIQDYFYPDILATGGRLS